MTLGLVFPDQRPQHATLSRFSDTVFGYLPRADQRRWAGIYLHGLLVARGRKSLRNIATGACSCCPTTATQSLHQFINSSPWDWQPARTTLARIARTLGPTDAWSASVATIPKRGDHSVGVQRRFVSDLGRTVNGQAAPILSLTGEKHALPVDWRLMLDRSWVEDSRRRDRARIPDDVRPQGPGQLLLEMVDEMAGELPPAPVVTDVHFAGEAAFLADELSRRELPFILRATPDQCVVPLASAARPLAAGEVLATVAESLERQCGPVGVQAPVRRIRTQSPSALVRLPQSEHPPPAGRRQRTLRLFSPPGRKQLWVTNLTGTSKFELLNLLGHTDSLCATLRQELTEQFGMADFEGRSFPGWHHHMTMVSAAYLSTLAVGPDLLDESSGTNGRRPGLGHFDRSTVWEQAS